MKTFLMMKIYAAIALAILGVRIALETLELMELVQFFGSVIIISLVATGLHKFFEHRAHTTGKNAAANPSFLVQMIVITILASTGLYMLLSYISQGEFSIGFDIIFYSLFVPAVILFGIWLTSKLSEIEYNEKLKELKEKR